MANFDRRRGEMVERQIVRRGVRDDRVLDAMRRVPRESFVSRLMREFAYEDSALPIEEAQTISQPYVVAAMIEAAALKPGDRVLEVGAGSGYAAAVMAEMAHQVFAIERHPRLAELASDRLRGLGYQNVRVRAGDGSLGWPEQAPFDAIIVSAGAPSIPASLSDELAPGGRLIIPIGENAREQRLIRLTRRAKGFEQDDLGAVSFVPLIGAEGWSPDGARPPSRQLEPRSWLDDAPDTLPRLIARAAEPLPDVDAAGFGAHFDRFGQAKVVLIGEATHGTSEFYRARAAITRRLIEEHGFTIVAAEADWPDAAVVDRFVRGLPARDGRPAPFARFPTWTWRNAEAAAFIGWLAARNADLPLRRRAGIHGLDLYSLNASLEAVTGYLEEVDPEAAAVARERYGCLTPWSHEPHTYGRMALSAGYAPCERGVVAMLTELLDRRLDDGAKDGESFLDAAQNARLIRDAEAYYRVMYYGSSESWNLRDLHMFDTLEHLLQARGADAKAVVWAHNSHIGDARHTEMGVVREELNLGQLCRERFGRDAVLIGLGTHTGTVAAASDWDGPMEVMPVRASLEGSIERLSHDSAVPRFLLDIRQGVNEALRHRLLAPRIERFIGVIYRPDTERLSHYAEASLPRQFDAWVWLDETSAVTPLPGPVEAGGEDTWPFGL